MITASMTEIVAQSMGRDHMAGWGGGWMWLWGTLMVLSWVIIITAAVWWVLRANRHGGTGRARDILDERLASGELTPEEYRERREALR
jgi:putative membrane protein